MYILLHHGGISKEIKVDRFFALCYYLKKRVTSIMSKEINNKTPDQEIINEITRSLAKMKYGELVITVHNAKVVQIEKREKKRFT